MTNGVPTIDLGGFLEGDWRERRSVAAAVDAACRGSGFLVIRGHGIPDRLLHQMHDVSDAFFRLPRATKRELEVHTDDDIGYKRLGNSYLTNTRDGESSAGPPPDWKETFGARPAAAPPDMSPREAPYFAVDVWPAALPEMRPVYTDYYRHMTRLSAALMAAFALGLGLEESYFDDKIDRHLSVLAVQHYPPQSTPPQPGQMRAGAHTDFGSLTILHTGSNPRGLQVRYADEWVDVTPAWDHLVVNIGDLMAQWSNDRWISTLHRVVNPTPDRAQMSRQSLTFFHSPNWHAMVECLPNCADAGHPPKYPPVPSGEYIESKLAMLRDTVAAPRP